jgi:ABC-type polysaccharide/polyol phosphate transport system ATPase subunit
LPFDSETASLAVPPTIEVQDLWLRYRSSQEATLKRTLVGMTQRRKVTRYVEALRGVSFTVQRGSVCGVIGRNGAGKSTLFRTICGILTPSEGRVVVRGHVTPLFSLGIGFNRELTGRENVLLGGLAMGLAPEEVQEQYQAIVAFAELADAIDYPMRTYSSGMSARLGFAVAVHLDPEIVLIDEALAAGDARFKKKSSDKISELCERDCTVMIITHGVRIISSLADRCLWLDKGRVMAEGPAPDVVDAYLRFEGVLDEATAAEDM